MRGVQRTKGVYHIHRVEIFPKSDIRQDYKYIALGFGLFDLDLCAHLNSLVTWSGWDSWGWNWKFGMFCCVRFKFYYSHKLLVLLPVELCMMQVQVATWTSLTSDLLWLLFASFARVMLSLVVHLDRSNSLTCHKGGWSLSSTIECCPKPRHISTITCLCQPH